MKKYKIIQWFKIDNKILKSQTSTNDRGLAFDLFAQGIKSKIYRDNSLIRTRGFNKMNKQKRIEELEKELKELKKSRFATVKFGKDKGILLTDEEGYNLIATWDLEKSLNNFELFEKCNRGHAFIHGQNEPFEIIDNKGNVLFKYNDFCSIRFLEELE